MVVGATEQPPRHARSLRDWGGARPALVGAATTSRRGGWTAGRSPPRTVPLDGAPPARARVALAVSLVSVERLLSGSVPPDRACGDCTACCTVMAVTELRKPSRRACDHVGRDGCRVHDARPESCRAFNCAWLRGVIAGGEAHRPDALGVMFDSFVERGSGATRVLAFELWPGALDAEPARAVVASLAAAHEVHVSRRDGAWSVAGSVGP